MHDKKTAWQPATLRNWYGEARRTLGVVSGTAVWYHSGLAPVSIRGVLIRDPKDTFKPPALLWTDLNVKPIQILEGFVLRWQLEVTFEEVRAHLGVETQRPWSDWAVVRTTPALLSLFSLVTLLAHHSTKHRTLPLRQAAWYTKRWPTFSDALAVVRSQVWHALSFRTSLSKTNMVKVPRLLLQRYPDALCYAA